MLILVTILAMLLILLWRWGGAVRAMLITWLVCLAPTALGLISYDYVVFSGTFYLWLIAASIGAFLAGTALGNAGNFRAVSTLPVAIDFTADYHRWQRFGSACLVIAAISVVMTILNILISGIDFSNLADVRADAIEMTSANIWARIAAITAWACFFCLGFGIYFRSEMSLGKSMLYIGAGAGIFASMLTLAGRNSVLQLIIFYLAIEAIRKARVRATGSKGLTGVSSRWAVVGAGVFYLLYITLNRPGNLDASDRSAVLFRLFNAQISPQLDATLNYIPFLKGPIVEFILYVTHTAPLFSVYITIDFGRHFFGIFSFPFVARQFEPLFGYSVADALNMKRFYVQSAGVIGFGWTTALSSFIMDFGYFGCGVFMFIQGYVSQNFYWRVRRGAGFGVVIMYVLLIISAVFTPFLPSFSDTNLFLLMVALLFMTYQLHRRKRGTVAVMPVGRAA